MKLGRKAQDDLIPVSSPPSALFVLRTWSRGPKQPLFVDGSQADLDPRPLCGAGSMTDAFGDFPAPHWCGQLSDRGLTDTGWVWGQQEASSS